MNKKSSIAYGVTIVLSIVIALFVTKFHAMDWRIPVLYSGDAPWALMMFKSLINNEWMPFTNPSSPFLAAPHSLTLGDFPFAEGMFFLIIKGIDIFIDDYVIAYNFYIILSYILASIGFVFAARKLKISYPVAISSGLLFSFLPYHFFRIQHIFLSTYFMVPLAIVILIMMWDEKALIFNKKERLFTIISLIIIGSSGVYYAFFFAFLAIIAGISSALYKKSKKHLISSGIIIAIVSATMIAHMLPSIIFTLQNGKNKVVTERKAIESEFYGLKLGNMVLPFDGHRASFLTGPTKTYQTYTRIPIEGQNEYIGIIALIGLAFLFIRLIMIKSEQSDYNKLSILALGSFLLGTIGGIGALFAVIVSPSIRSYNRISIFIAAIALIAVALYLQSLKSKLSAKKWYAVISLVCIIGILDQSSATMHFTQAEAPIFLSDQAFVQKIEKTVPEGSRIFQLPYAGFPEYPPVHKMRDYSHFKGYLHSDNLKWSYGAVKGRPEDDWYKYTNKLSLNDFVKRLQNQGFSGIYIDRFGYEDGGQKIENAFRKFLKTPAIVSRDQRLSFFSIQ